MFFVYKLLPCSGVGTLASTCLLSTRLLLLLRRRLYYHYCGYYRYYPDYHDC